MAIISDIADGLPAVSVYVAPAALPHEVTTLAEATVSKCFVAGQKPEHLLQEIRRTTVTPLDVKLAVDHEVELIAPHSYNRQVSSTQDGQPLRRYKRRWKIERGCLHGCRISDISWCVMTVMQRIFLDLFSLDVYDNLAQEVFMRWLLLMLQL